MVKKFGTGGSASITYGGQGQINKQRTRFGSKFGNKLNVPNESLNKYEGMATGGRVGRPDLQKVNKPKTDHGKNTLFNKGGVMKMEHSEKKEMKTDLSQDKKMIKRAFSMHDKQEHKGEKTDLSALKKGGRIAAKGEHSVQKQSKRGAEMIKMARGGGIEVRGKTKGTMVKMCGGGMKGKK